MDIIVNGNRPSLPDEATLIQGFNDYFLNIVKLLNLDSESTPLGNFLSQYYEFEGHWLIASPIHWEAGHNDAMITEIIDLTEPEAKDFFNALATFLKEDNFTPHYLHANRWLFRVDTKPAIQSRALFDVLSKSMMPLLAGLDRQFYWQRLHTELQMFLTNHPLNLQYRASKASANGLWFWGEGNFSMATIRPIFTDDEKLIKLWPFLKQLDEKTKLSKSQLIIINNTQSIADFDLEKKSKKFQTNWYWNNLAYQAPIRGWRFPWR